MTAERAERQAADLLRRGYTEVQEWEHLHVGDRVKHVGELYTHEPTATIERIFHRQWAARHHTPDVELIVKRDKPPSSVPTTASGPTTTQ